MPGALSTGARQAHAVPQEGPVRRHGPPRIPAEREVHRWDRAQEHEHGHALGFVLPFGFCGESVRGTDAQESHDENPPLDLHQQHEIDAVAAAETEQVQPGRSEHRPEGEVGKSVGQPLAEPPTFRRPGGQDVDHA
jgi:hypothetical protein